MCLLAYNVSSTNASFDAADHGWRTVDEPKKDLMSDVPIDLQRLFNDHDFCRKSRKIIEMCP